MSTGKNRLSLANPGPDPLRRLRAALDVPLPISNIERSDGVAILDIFTSEKAEGITTDDPATSAELPTES